MRKGPAHCRLLMRRWRQARLSVRNRRTSVNPRAPKLGRVSLFTGLQRLKRETPRISVREDTLPEMERLKN
ncbi:hypothetical protein AXF42_Ash006388 [Apostasia shenzhenica]|uniref:Uncharacterized protein n=1 Tax=Apostasia shenzhenica TaxID=1088818 RepID=A0A2I0AYZ5_9ASPA|nr:hypothetical protein AXF42_Ash006388 [Apostasia shenzhenica]